MKEKVHKPPTEKQSEKSETESDEAMEGAGLKKNIEETRIV